MSTYSAPLLHLTDHPSLMKDSMADAADQHGGRQDDKKRPWRSDNAADDGGRFNNKHQRGPGMFGIKILIPNSLVGAVIGRGGEEMKKLKEDTSCFVKISQNNKYFPNSRDRPCYVEGEPENVNRALRIIQDKITNDNAKRGPGTVDEQRKKACKIIIGSNAAGKTIGKGGENVIRLKESFNVFVKVMSRDEIIQGLDERTVTVSSNTGDLDNIMDATCDIVDMAAQMTNGGTDKNLDYDYFMGGDGPPPPAVGQSPNNSFNNSYNSNNSFTGRSPIIGGRGGGRGGGFSGGAPGTGGYQGGAQSYNSGNTGGGVPIQQYGGPGGNRGAQTTTPSGYGNNIGGSTYNQGGQTGGYQSGGGQTGGYQSTYQSANTGYQSGGGGAAGGGYQAGGATGYQSSNTGGYQSGGNTGYQGSTGGGYQGGNQGYQGGNTGGYQASSRGGGGGGRGGGGGYNNNSRGGGGGGGRGGSGGSYRGNSRGGAAGGGGRGGSGGRGGGGRGGATGRS